MKILITGSNGQLGNELVSIIKSGKSQIGAIDKIYKNAEIIAVDVDVLDISNFSQVDSFIKKNKPDLIFNCAAMTNVNACETNLETAMKVNAIGPRNLAKAAQKYAAKLVHVSTDYVFNGDGIVPYCEWDLTSPNTVYGKSKLLGEKYVAEQANQYFIVRTSWLYGLVGNNFVKTMINIGENNAERKVVDDQRGNPTNANDLAHHILKIALTDEYGIYHCTGEGECSWCDFAKKIMQLSALNCNIIPCKTYEFPSPAPRPSFSSLNNLMLKCTVGNEMRNWEIALENYITVLNETEKIL